MRRTRSLKISAPPPGSESMPASRRRSSVSRTEILWRARQIGDLHHREGFQMHLRKALLQAAQHLAVPIQRQLRMQAADDVKLGDRFAPAFAGAMPHLFERHGVGLGIAHLLAEGAQAATGHADIGGVDVAVDVEISGVAVQALAHQVGHVAQRQNVLSAVKRDAIFKRQAFARFHFFADRQQAGVLDVNSHGVTCIASA